MRTLMQNNLLALILQWMMSGLTMNLFSRIFLAVFALSQLTMVAFLNAMVASELSVGIVDSVIEEKIKSLELPGAIEFWTDYVIDHIKQTNENPNYAAEPLAMGFDT